MAEEAKGPRGGVTPHIVIGDGRAQDAVAFYIKAFGASEAFRYPAEDGNRLLHCHLSLNGGSLMLADDFPEHCGGQASPPPASVTLHLQVEDADAVCASAVAAGATVTMPVELQFWGDRYGQIEDPFGHRWSIASTPNAE